MALTVYNPGQKQDINLDHAVMCTEEECLCTKKPLVSWHEAKDGSRAPRHYKQKLHGSMTILHRETKTDVPDAFEKLPQVRQLLAVGKLKILARV